MSGKSASYIYRIPFLQLHRVQGIQLERPVIVIRGKDADRLMTIVNSSSSSRSRRTAIARIKTDFPLRQVIEVRC